MSIDRLNPNLSGFDALNALERQALEGRQGLLEGDRTQAPADAGLGEALRAPAVDEGELVLAAPAWDAGAPRLLPADGFQLHGGDRGRDLDAGVVATVAPLV